MVECSDDSFGVMDLIQDGLYLGDVRAAEDPNLLHKH